LPNLDGTGPLGQVPLTGRRKGCCGDKQTAKIENQTTENIKNIYGLGRGKRPRRDGEFGNRFSGGYGKRQGRGLGRGLISER